MHLNLLELNYIKHTLIAKRAYRCSPIDPLYKVWDPWMEDFLIRINDAIEIQSTALQERGD